MQQEVRFANVRQKKTSSLFLNKIKSRTYKDRGNFVYYITINFLSDIYKIQTLFNFNSDKK